MSVSLDWYNQEKTILLEKFDGVVTIEDCHQVVDKKNTLLKSRPCVVHLLADFSTVNRGQMPDNLLAVQRYAEYHLPPNQGIRVFIQPDLMLVEIIKIGRRLNLSGACHTFRAASYEEALQVIAANAYLVQGRDSFTQEAGIH